MDNDPVLDTETGLPISKKTLKRRRTIASVSELRDATSTSNEQSHDVSTNSIGKEQDSQTQQLPADSAKKIPEEEVEDNEKEDIDEDDVLMKMQMSKEKTKKTKKTMKRMTMKMMKMMKKMLKMKKMKMKTMMLNSFQMNLNQPPANSQKFGRKHPKKIFLSTKNSTKRYFLILSSP